ncbi:MAG: polysaccharide deacetylase family protein [Bacteroidota bacterium]
MLLVYSPRFTYRLEYILDLFLKELLGTDYRIIQDEQEFLLHQGPKFSYADKPVGQEPFFYATSLLFERGIRAQEIAVFDWEGSKAFFATHPRFLMPFDPFAAAFYLVSRYEEYLPGPRDQHNRFDARHSLAFQKGFLHHAVVNRWANRIGEILLQHFPGLPLKKPTYRFISTIDIDNAWAYRDKGLLRTCGALMKSAMQLNGSVIAERLAVIAKRKPDPYDTYQELERIRESYSLECVYFFLVGDYDEHDRNVSVSRRNFRSLIKSISDYNVCGLHPSYRSNDEPDRLRMEQTRLSKIVRRDIHRSRQHFLRMTMPETYRRLIDCDITDDYTMGYAQDVGFRAGICSSFLFYDIGAEQTTSLRIHPFAVMDATLRNYLLLQADEAMARVLPLIQEARAVGGTLMTLWHNESLSNLPPWNGWSHVYEQVVRAATAQRT